MRIYNLLNIITPNKKYNIMKLKSKLKLYEEFTASLVNEAAGESNQNSTVNSVAIDQTTTQPSAAEIIRTEVIRDVDTILSNLMELSDRVEESNEFEIDELYEELFDATNITDLNEGILDFIKSPIKFTRIQMNMKKYQKALIQQSINDVDFAKKKQASAEDPDPKALEVLKQANLAKNKALKDQADAIADRMTQLAEGDEGLNKVIALGKAKSKLQAAKVVMKATSGEEAKQLKLEIDTLEDRVAADEKSLKDYAAAQTKGEAEQTSQDQLDGTEGTPKGKKGGYQNEGLDGSGRLSSMINEEDEAEETEEAEVEIEVKGDVEVEVKHEGEEEKEEAPETEETEEAPEAEETEETEETPEVEESTKAKIYEGMSIAERFKALM